MLVVISYMAALLSIALWAAWQLVVSYAEPRRELIHEVDRAPARITRISTELLGTTRLISLSPANAQCAGAADLRAPRSLPGLAGATSIHNFAGLAPIAVCLAALGHGHLVEHQLGQVLLRRTPKRLPQLGGVDSVQADLVLAVLSVEHRDGVAVMDADDAALDGLRSACVPCSIGRCQTDQEQHGDPAAWLAEQGARQWVPV
jgi:hypothetical protein